MTEPTWGTAAKLDGIGLRSEGSKWQKATVAVVGSMADCIAKWLELPGFKQRGCWLQWGYAYDGVHGRMEPEAIAGYVLKHGLPAHVAGTIGGQPPQEDLKWIVAMPRFDHDPTFARYKAALECAAARTA